MSTAKKEINYSQGEDNLARAGTEQPLELSGLSMSLYVQDERSQAYWKSGA